MNIYNIFTPLTSGNFHVFEWFSAFTRPIVFHDSIFKVIMESATVLTLKARVYWKRHYDVVILLCLFAAIFGKFTAIFISLIRACVANVIFKWSGVYAGGGEMGAVLGIVGGGGDAIPDENMPFFRTI